MIVLNFHLIGRPQRTLAPGEADVALDRRQFAEILDAVAGRSEVHLTFDDGNESDVTEALPELQRRGLRAEFFVCPARIGRPAFLDEGAVQELRRAGMSLGSHGMDHVPWRRLEPSAMDREIAGAKRALQELLQAPVDSAACPFGAYDRRTLGALRRAGFTRVYTSDRGWATSHDWLVPRNTVCRWDSAESVERLLDGPARRESPALRAKRWIKRRR